MTTAKKPIQKAYMVNLDRIDEGYLHDSDYSTVTADSIGKARKKLFEMSRDMTLRNGAEITFTNLPIIRNPKLDLYDFEGQHLSKRKIEEIVKERQRLSKLQEILVDESIVYVFIFKRGCYYGNNWCGYTDAQHRAGVYNKSEAISHARGCEELTVIPINIDNYNNMLSKEIENLELKKENINIEIKNLQLKHL
jgi:hypothetical protein